MYYRAKSTIKRLTITGLAIDIVLADPVLLETMEKVAFGKERLIVGLNYHKEASRLHSEKTIASGRQKEATLQVRKIAKEVRSRLLIDRRVVSATLKPGRIRQLGITGKTPEAFIPLANRAAHFYTTLLQSDEMLAVTMEYHLNPESIQQRISQVAALKEAMKHQTFSKGKAQATTSQFHTALRTMDEWMSDFIKAARFAFRTQPKQLVKLGIYSTA